MDTVCSNYPHFTFFPKEKLCYKCIDEAPPQGEKKVTSYTERKLLIGR